MAGLSDLSEIDRGFLDAVRGGQSARQFALQHHYTPDWAKWKSREIRRKLGVRTIAEALQMSELLPEEVEQLKGLLPRLDELEKATKTLADATRRGGSTSRERENVKEKRSDLDDTLGRLGLTMEDLEQAAKSKRRAEFEGFYQERRAQEEAEAEATRKAAAAAAKAKRDREAEDAKPKGFLAAIAGIGSNSSEDEDE